MEIIVDITKQINKKFILKTKLSSGNFATALLGASGSGKSMTLKCIAGIEKPDAGKIVLNGRVLFDSEKGINLSIKDRKVGYLFQNYALFPNMTVEKNIAFGITTKDKTERTEIVKHKIEIMKLQGLEKRYPHQLSGGQQQRVAFARALAIKPDILLLDEPFSALDDHLRNMLNKQLLDILEEFQGPTLFVTHNMEEAYRICKQIYVMNNGVVEAMGHRDEVFHSPGMLSVAQLTGCKNFSEAKLEKNGNVFAKDWGIHLTVKGFTEQYKFTGIRANFIKQANGTETCNVFDSWPVKVVETPFRATVYLNLFGDGQKNHQLQWEISKERYRDLCSLPYPWKIWMDPDKILFLK